MNQSTLQTKNIKPGLIILWLLIMPFAFFACQNNPIQQKWVGTWSTAPQLVEPHNMPPEPGLSHNTLRQVLRVSVGGDSLRLYFSNQYGNSPVTMEEVQLALSEGESAIDPATLKPITFNGSKSVTMNPGESLVSDVIAFKLENRDDLAVSIFFGETSPHVTGHPGSRTTSYIAQGNQLSANALNNATKAERWYILTGIDVKTGNEAAAIAIIGNSITDGRGSGTDKQNRWPDILSEQLLENEATQQVAVLNQGVGGNCVLRYCLGPSALDRFTRDVIEQSGVKWFIILHGVNDLGQTPNRETAVNVAHRLIDAYEQMINEAHENNIKAYGATILPFGESFYYTDFREEARKIVNQWIRESGRFDAVIDFDSIMRNPDKPSTLLPDVHSGDFLHPNEYGYELMGKAIDLDLFR